MPTARSIRKAARKARIEALDPPWTATGYCRSEMAFRLLAASWFRLEWPAIDTKLPRPEVLRRTAYRHSIEMECARSNRLAAEAEGFRLP